MFFWRGIYKCINEQCYSSFNCIIKGEPTHGGSILITWPKIRIHHEKLKKVFKIKIVSNFFLNFCFKKIKRLSGINRKQTAKNIFVYGIKVVRNQNILINRENKCKMRF